jgi:hypothetical protein
MSALPIYLGICTRWAWRSGKPCSSIREATLHGECVDAAEPGGRQLLPLKMLLVAGPDGSTLGAALRRAHQVGPSPTLAVERSPVPSNDGECPLSL